MKYARLAGVILLFAGSVFADEASNAYGTFSSLYDGTTYTVKFLVNPENKKFSKYREVSIIDYSNNSEGDAVAISYKNGNKEIFFRGKHEFRRYVAAESLPSEICGSKWSPRIVFRSSLGRWECVEMNFFYRTFMWWEIDAGLAEAKKEDWSVLAERILSGIRKIAK